PLATWVLWILGIVVTVLFLAALWRVTHRRGAVARPQPARPKAEAATVRVRGRSSRLLTAEPVRGRSRIRRASDLRRLGNWASRHSPAFGPRGASLRVPAHGGRDGELAPGVGQPALMELGK